MKNDLFVDMTPEDWIALEVFYDDVFANLPEPTEENF